MSSDPTPTMIARLTHDLAFEVERAAALARVAAGEGRTRDEPSPSSSTSTRSCSRPAG